MLTAQIIYAFVMERRAPAQVEKGACSVPFYAWSRPLWPCAPPCKLDFRFSPRNKKRSPWSKGRRYQVEAKWLTKGRAVGKAERIRLPLLVISQAG